MNADVARTLIAGQKIKYWDDRIATVTIPYSPPVTVLNFTIGLEAYSAKEVDGEIAIVFDATPDPKPVHYLKDYDFRLAEPL